MEKKRGLYLGTEIDGKWWRRYTKDGFFCRGNGEYWYDDQGFYFLRSYFKQPIFIAFSTVSEAKTGKFHSGKWCFGAPILKIIWKKDNLLLSSGFVPYDKYNKREDTQVLLNILQQKIKK